MDFQLIEFNHRRWQRGAEAARVEIREDGESAWLWMSERDVRANIREFGPHPELQRALDAYTAAPGKALHERVASNLTIDPATVAAQLVAAGTEQLRELEDP